MRFTAQAEAAQPGGGVRAERVCRERGEVTAEALQERVHRRTDDARATAAFGTEEFLRFGGDSRKCNGRGDIFWRALHLEAGRQAFRSGRRHGGGGQFVENAGSGKLQHFLDRRSGSHGLQQRFEIALQGGPRGLQQA
jgi:hypothetical protein